MRLILLPVLCAASLMAACDDDATSPTDTTGGDTTADTGGGDTATTDTTANDTTPGDTTANDTTPGDTTANDTTPGDTTANDTTPGDTTANDTTPGDTATDTDTSTGDDGAGICPGILSCISECTTQQCYQSCLGAADSQDEAAYVQEYIVCLDDNGCFPDVAAGEQPTDQQIIDSIKCEHEHCLDANAECSSGGTYGNGTCSNIFVCLNACESNTDIPCQRACFAEATQESVAAWYDLNYCLNEECYTAESFSACAQTAIETPPCQLAYTACAGDAGAAPGAAGGGGFKPSQRFEMRAFGK